MGGRRAARGWAAVQGGVPRGLSPREGEAHREGLGSPAFSLAARAQASREYDSTFGQPRNPRLIERALVREGYDGLVQRESDSSKEAAARSPLGCADADAGAVADFVGGVEYVDYVEADGGGVLR